MSSMRTLFIAVLLVAILSLAAGCTQPQNNSNGSDSKIIGQTPSAGIPVTTTTPVPVEAWKRARLETSMGNITIALDPSMPVTTGNFERLVSNGYYNGVIFHRVIDGFMIQGGDPTGTGRGGPGYMIKDEFLPTNRNDRGTVAMANSGPNTGGSQFFINLVNNNYLDRKHPVFGRIVEGMDVVDAIGKVPTTGDTGGNRPLQNVTILRAEMI